MPMARLEAHPSVAELAAFSLGTLADGAYSAIESHVAGCTTCQERAASAPGDNLTELLRSVHAHGGLGANADVQTPVPVEAAVPTLSVALTDVPSGNDSATVPSELAQHERYRVRRLLGTGGMGAVYEAEHRVMERTVALKVINRALTTNAAAVERFRREVRNAARLSHPNIVTTYDAEDAGDTLFLVMEHAAGVTLGRLVEQRGPLPVAEACTYVRQAALGLQHAHECGMVHRDVKPDNLILMKSVAASAPDIVKVVDFGLAALTAERSHNLTGTNVVMGTPDFMAPEQAEDTRAADIRADIYSLGCTLYYLLTGQVPYPTTNWLHKILAHREQPVPNVRCVRPEVSRGVARVLERMIAKQPEDRYPTPADVAAALEPFTHGDGDAARKRFPILAASAAAAVFSGLLLAGGAVYRIQTDKGELAIAAQDDAVEVFVRQGGKVVHVIDTKTESRIVLRSGVYDLELKDAPAGLKLDIERATLLRGKTVLATIERVATLRPAAIASDGIRYFPHPGVRGVKDVAFSPDSRFLVAIDGGVEGFGTVRMWEVASGKLVRDFDGFGWAVVRYSQDGKQLRVLLPKGVRVFDVETEKVVHDLPEEALVWAGLCSPDGRYMLTWSETVSRLWDLETGKQLRRWDGSTTRPLDFTHDSKQLILFDGPNVDLPFRLWNILQGTECAGNGMPARGLFTGSFLQGGTEIVVCAKGMLHIHDRGSGKVVRRIDLGPGMEGDHGRHRGTVSRDGRLFFALGLDARLHIWDLRTGKELPLPQPDRAQPRTGNLTIAPNNRWAAVSNLRQVLLIRLPDPPSAADAH
jgi:WD40 repeat protein/tRNA A-37 threonylcarbamoyl transferase component Bud32